MVCIYIYIYIYIYIVYIGTYVYVESPKPSTLNQASISKTKAGSLAAEAAAEKGQSPEEAGEAKQRESSTLCLLWLQRGSLGV